MAIEITYETTSDALLVYLEAFLNSSGQIPAAVDGVKLRDWGGTKGRIEVVLDAEDPVEHEVLAGVEMIAGEVTLNISPDDVKSEQDRRWMLGRLERVLRYGFAAVDGDPLVCFQEWLEDADAGLKLFEFRVGGSAWESEGERLHGKINWMATACLAE